MRSGSGVLEFLVLFAVAFGAWGANAETVRAERYSEVRARLLQMDMVVFDLDSTLVKSERMFGSDAWFMHEWEEGQRRGLSREEARKAAEAMSDRLQATLKHDSVEPTVADLIRELQSRGVKVMILTARRSPQVDSALRALRETGIDMTVTAPKLAVTEGLLYTNGALFANGERKGPVLERFLKAANLNPRSIAFVDDQIRNLNSVIGFMRAVTPSFLAVHYTGAEHSNDQFRADISNFQKTEFLAGRRIPSDASALVQIRAGAQCRQTFL